MEKTNMKYAVISDIHGNLPGLQAVLSDAKAQGADKYLFLGDYITNYTWCNEVLDLIRSLDNAVAVSGNHEEVYYQNLHKADKEEWRIDKQYETLKLLYWAYKQLSPKNLQYILELPVTQTIAEHNINMVHASKIFFREPKVDCNHTYGFWKMVQDKPITHEEFLALGREEMLARPDVVEDILALPKGLYLFGHNHLQFHMEYEGRLFVNPGSCGEPLDCNTDAAYTIVEYDDGTWTINERRVPYDVDMVREKLMKSETYAYTPDWCYILLGNLTGRDYTADFIGHLNEVSQEMGQQTFPASNEAWERAFKTWGAEY